MGDVAYRPSKVVPDVGILKFSSYVPELLLLSEIVTFEAKRIYLF